MMQELYTSGAYLKQNPGWHIEESPWKADQIMRMLKQNALTPKTICEVGCGAGGVLEQVQAHMSDECVFWGYDISPQALELARSRANDKLQFKLADFTREEDVFFDLILVMDVIEHLEDYFRFLRAIRRRSTYKILHIPLDLSVQTVLRRDALLKVRGSYGHIHYFTRETALRVVQEAGYEVLDHFYTSRAVELPSKEIPRRLLKLPRSLLFALHKDLAAHILGGFSLLVLAR